MEKMNLDMLVRRIRAEPLPPCPADLAARVLSRVRRERSHADAAGREALWSGLSAFALRPQMAAAHVAESATKAGYERAAKFAPKVAAAESLAAAREAFIPLSRETIMLAAGKEGYFVMSCPMVENGKWLQSDEAVRNPYMGQRMIACGGVVSETASMELRVCCEERRACCDDGGACCPA